MQNFDNKIIKLEKTLSNIRGVSLKKNNIAKKLEDIEKTLLKENF